MIETIALYGITGTDAFVILVLLALGVCVLLFDEPTQHVPDSPADVRRVDPVPVDVDYVGHRLSSNQVEQRNHG